MATGEALVSWQEPTPEEQEKRRMQRDIDGYKKANAELVAANTTLMNRLKQCRMIMRDHGMGELYPSQVGEDTKAPLMHVNSEQIRQVLTVERVENERNRAYIATLKAQLIKADIAPEQMPSIELMGLWQEELKILEDGNANANPSE